MRSGRVVEAEAFREIGAADEETLRKELRAFIDAYF